MYEEIQIDEDFVLQDTFPIFMFFHGKRKKRKFKNLKEKISGNSM